VSAAAQPIDPDSARRIVALTIEIERAALSLRSGKHKSPHRGASVVFVEHREYRPGDDPRLIDWRAYARSDRHTIKRFEQEAQLGCTLLLDVSRSMDFAGIGGARTKLEHAAGMLAGIALVLRKQSDAIGLVRFARTIETTLPMRSSISHVDRVLSGLGLGPTTDSGTDLRGALRAAAERSKRRGLVVVATDGLDLERDALGPLSDLAARGHEVWLLHVLTSDELELRESGAARYVGLEGEDAIEADPDVVRAAYAHEVGAFVRRLRDAATERGARCRLTRTDEPIVEPLAELMLRGRRTRWA
jgi:uncharacterized protein (DUF58 family)